MSRVRDESKEGHADRRRSARSRSTVRAARLLETISDELIALDREWRFTYVNRAALKSI